MDEAKLKELGLDPELLRGPSTPTEDVPVEGKNDLQYSQEVSADVFSQP
jgi:hypothetical protein